MSKKHFIAIAYKLWQSRPLVGTLPKPTYTQWIMDCEAVANALQELNPRFDRNKFLSTCRGK